MAIDDYLARGMTEAEAQRLARLKFGSAAAAKDAHRDARGLQWLDAASFDVRLAVRGLARDRAFALTTISMLALALALNVTVFVVMDAMLFRGYPLVKQSNRILFLQERGPSGMCCLSYPDFADWREHAKSFERAAGTVSSRPWNCSPRSKSPCPSLPSNPSAPLEFFSDTHTALD